MVRYVTKTLRGDGRHRLTPNPKIKIHKYGDPRPVNRATARRLVEAFKERGYSVHSGAGNTVWVMLEYCYLNGIQCCVRIKSDEGIVLVKEGGE